MIKLKVTQKKVPGKGWEFMIYNALDQVVATQDSVQRMKSPQEWIITKYDAMGRVIITGTYQHSGSMAGTDMRTVIQGLADGQSAQWEGLSTVTSHGYTSNCWPASWAQSLVINYYDSYAGIPAFPSMYNQVSNTLYSKRTAGLPTASRTLVLNTAGDYLWTVPYYDEDGQVIRTFTQHYLGGSSALSQYNYDDVQPVYNFVKQPISVLRYHNVKNSGGTATLSLTSTDVYTYDHMGRKLKSYNTLKDGASAAQQQVLVSRNVYNELGQLKQKSLHSLTGSFLQNVDYRYNARGWLTNINNGSLGIDSYTSTDSNDQFGMDIKYYDAGTPQYNGNIGSIKSLTGIISGNSYPALTYNYTYDKLNRLTDAISTTATSGDGFYSENLAYDNMGNIQTLKRYDKNGTSAQLIDNLNYIYVSGSKVDRIDDSGTTAGFNNTVSQAGEYTYDGNGNQLTDLNRSLTQAYNLLNLPQTVTKSGVSIAYIYDATGRKLRKLSTSSGTTTVTEYIGGIQYQYSTTTPVLDFISTEEGRARKSGSVYKYEYDLKDHLGNTRITTTWNASDATQMTPSNSQRSDYYAFGYAIQSLVGTTPSPKNEYLYNHKELQEETGLYDYGARFYDPVIARWTSVDPLAEKMRRYGPYDYAFDNPVRFIDPDGMKPGDVFTSMDEAAKDWGRYYNGNSIWANREYASSIYTVVKDGKTFYAYTKAEAGDSGQSNAPVPWWNNTVADIHSHAGYNEKLDYQVDPQTGKYVDWNNTFSPRDEKANKQFGYPGYVVTPNGSLQKYDPETDKTTPISSGMPSDPRDNGRVNKIKPVFNEKLEIYLFKDALHDLLQGSEHNKGNNGGNDAYNTIMSWIQKNPSIKLNFE